MNNSPWGGSEELWSSAALYLRKAGHSVAICVRRWPNVPPAVQRMLEAGIGIHYHQQFSPGLVMKAVNTFRGRNTESHIRRKAGVWLAAQQPDLVCISTGNYFDGLEWMIACRERSLPYLTLSHGNAEFLWPDDRMINRITAAYQSARKCCFVSHHNKNMLQNQLAVELPNACVVQNPVKVGYDSNPVWPDSSAGYRLACVARLDPALKGQDLLLQVLSQEKWRQRQIKVALYGTGYGEQTLKQLAKHWRMENVEFHGHVENVEAIWSRHHALILTSRIEGLPLALVEAMLCHRFGIVTDVGGNSELIEDGVSGFIAEAPTVALVDNAMERAWQRREEWVGIGLEARKRATSIVERNPVEQFSNLIASTV